MFFHVRFSKGHPAGLHWSALPKKLAAVGSHVFRCKDKDPKVEYCLKTYSPSKSFNEVKNPFDSSRFQFAEGLSSSEKQR